MARSVLTSVLTMSSSCAICCVRVISSFSTALLTFTNPLCGVFCGMALRACSLGEDSVGIAAASNSAMSSGVRTVPLSKTISSIW